MDAKKRTTTRHWHSQLTGPSPYASVSKYPLVQLWYPVVTCLSGAGWPGCRVRPWRRANINSHLHRRKNVDPAGGMRVALCHDDLAEEPRRACFATSLSKQESNTLSFAAGPRKLRYNYKLQPPCLLVRYKLHRPGMHGLHDRASINKRGTCQSKDNRARQRCNMRWAA